MARPSLSAPGMTFRAALLVAVALTFIGCDKPGPDDGHEGGGTAVASEGDSTGATDGSDTSGGDDSSGTTDAATTTEGESSTGSPTTDACDAERFGEARACEGGMQYCASDNGYPEVKYFWGPCEEEFTCVPGAKEDCRECELAGDGLPVWFDTCGGTSTPLVLSFGGEPVRYDSSSAAFDLGPQCGATDWPQAATPWLALDRDGSGAIESGRELFGSATVLRRGALADNGFYALAELDHDRDGRLTPADPEFARLLLWADHDGDRRSTAWELTPVAAAGITAIGLTYRNDARCDGRYNCEIERAAFTFKDALGHERAGEVVDVHLGCQ